METSKLYKLLGNKVGIKATRKSQRGIIARRAIQSLENEQMAEFEAQMVNLLPKSKGLKVNYMGKSYYI